jgi:hypothetical protein
MTWLSYQLTETDLISAFVYLIEILALGSMRGGMDLTKNRHMFGPDHMQLEGLYQIPLSSLLISFKMYTKLVVWQARSRVKGCMGIRAEEESPTVENR